MKTRIFKDKRYWICKDRNDWWDEVRITKFQADRALKILDNLGLIEKKLYKFNGTPKIHISINPIIITKKLKEIYEQKGEQLQDIPNCEEILFDDKEYSEKELSEIYINSLKGVRKQALSLAKSKQIVVNAKLNNLLTIMNSDKDLKEYCFEVFMQIYDNNKSIKRAYSAFQKLSWKKVIAALKAVNDYISVTEKEFRLLAHNYLNDERYNDEIKSVSQDPSYSRNKNISNA